MYLLKGGHAYRFVTDILHIDGYPQLVDEVFPNIEYWMDVKIKYSIDSTIYRHWDLFLGSN